MASKARSKEDLDWRGARIAATVEPDTRYTLHRVTNLIFAVCQFAAMICHIICFGVLLNKINEIKDKIGRPPGEEVCLLYIGVTDTVIDGETYKKVEYNGGHSCDFVIFGSIILAIMAGIMLIFFIVRILLVNKMNFIGVFDVVEIIIAIVLTFAVSVTLSIGRSVTCDNFKDGADTCNGAYIVPITKEHPQVMIYSAMKSSETSSWVAFLFLLVVAVVSILRTIIWFRKVRQERRFKVAAGGLIKSEVPPSTDEVDEDKTPAAI